MKKILLDTNFLMIPSQYKVDIYAEIDRLLPAYQLTTLDVVIDELKKLALKGKGRYDAKLALALLKHKKVIILHSKNKTLKNADEIILNTANKDNYIVCTQDRGLKRLLRQKKVPLIVLRQKNHLDLLI